MKQLARRLLGVFMAMMMLLTALPSAFALESDIKGHWAEEALQSFADDGYLAGDGRGHYTPNGVMTRAQFATIMNRVVGLRRKVPLFPAIRTLRHPTGIIMNWQRHWRLGT